jgi:hypothetical protein
MKIALILLIFTFNPSSLWAVRPFVTDDARITDVRQLEFETWTEFARSSSEVTLGQHIMTGFSFTEWLQVIGGFGLGHDFDANEIVMTNPVIQPKFLLWQAYDDGFPGLALATGITLPYGQGAYYDDATGYYAMAMTTTRLFKDWLLIHLNLGQIFAKEKNESTISRHYWGLGFDIGIVNIDYRLIAEAYAGDPFEALGPDLAFQAGFRWLKNDFLNYDLTFGTQPELNENGNRSGRWEGWAQIGVRLLFDNFRGPLGPGLYEGAPGAFNPRAKFPIKPQPEFNPNN